MAGFAAQQFMRGLRSIQPRLHPSLPFSSTITQPQRSLRGENHPNIIRSDYPEIIYPDIPLHEFMYDKISLHGKKIGIECSVTGRSYTYDEVIRKSQNFGRALRKKLKMQRNDIVGMLLPNIPEFPIASMGILSGGGIITTMNPMYTAEEIKRQMTDSGAKILITLAEFYPMVKNVVGTSIPIITINNKKNLQTPEGSINFHEFCDSQIDLPDLKDFNISNIAFIPYSSGTTGLPKGVCLSHKNLLTNLLQISTPELNLIEESQGDKQDIIPAILPFFHIFGFTCLSGAAMQMGAKLITMTQFVPELYAKILLQQKPTVLFIVPPIVIFLNVHPMITKQHLESCRVALSGAAPLGPLDIIKFEEKSNKAKIIQGYGLSETSPAVLIQPWQGNAPHGSAGKIVPSVQIKIMPIDDPNGEPLGSKQTGECYVKGCNVMERYHNRPKETAETIVDGWLRTGDLVYYDENRNFFITDRIKELIKVKGFQVPPAELEEILRDHPDVGDAAVIGIPHDISGEVPRAYLVAKAGKKIRVDEINEFINQKVAVYKRLKGGIEVLQTIPKNPSGKILRKELKSKYLAAS